MSEIDERRSALDEFAALSNSPTTTQPMQQIIEAEYSRGAVKVAVYRDEARVFQKLKAAAAYAGTDFFYRFPVKNRKENRTDWIEGPSIKLANELARLYGNCKTGVKVTDNGDSWVFSAVFIDLETGFELVRPFQQRKSAGKIGGADEERRLDIAFQIGASKAIRNVVVNALQSFADFALHEAKNALVERIGKDLEGYRQRTAAKLANMVAIDRVEAVVGRPVKDWLAQDVARVIAMATSIADGMSNLDDTFPPLQDPSKASSTSNSLSSFAEADASAGADQTSDTQSLRTTPGPVDSEASLVGAAEQPAKEQEPAADLFTRLEQRLAQAPNEAACEQVWEQLGIDAAFADDARGRAQANKLLAKRVKEVRNG